MTAITQSLNQQRKIIHFDCDCFFAAVEIRDDPLLAGKPVAVGGESRRRGVIATCNYEARRFGVRSAMATGYAKKLCPELILVPPAFEKYRMVSHQIHDIFSEYTELIEPLSLDEAFLDVSGSSLCQGSATFIAREIKKRVLESIGIVISAGVAPNKFLAKVASDWDKPDGLFVITPDEVDSFVCTLPLKKLFGVGQSMQEKLAKMGLKTCADVRDFDQFELVRHFGKMGKRVYELSHGLDERPVSVDRQRKSISVETTYANDLSSVTEVTGQVQVLLRSLQGRMEKYRQTRGVVPEIKSVVVKVKFDDFSVTTLERSGGSLAEEQVTGLLLDAWARKKRPVRLLGVGVKLQQSQDSAQISLIDS